MPAPSLIRVENLTGADLQPILPDLARLRTTVFRAWPYLYDGETDDEQKHLVRYAASPNAIIVVARDGDRAVGMSTALPMTAEGPAVREPFEARGWDAARFFYFGESVLLPEYRGRGIGVEFFHQREAHARRAGTADYACFCAIQRPADHPARPADYVPLDAFWRHRGYHFYPDLVCRMRWKEVGQPAQTEHTLAFWLKPLREAALP